MIEDEEAREQAPTIGYYAMFEYTNGFRKTLYWSKQKMQNHAKKYSKGYAADLSKGTAWTFWSKDFDGMAMKTMLRQLISKWGVMSIDMITAMESDAAVIKEDLTPDYVESEAVPEPAKEAPQQPQEPKEEPKAQTPAPEPEKPQEKPQAAPQQQDAVMAALFGNQ